MADELQIAVSRAVLLHRCRNWGKYSTYDASHDLRFSGLDNEILEIFRFETLTKKLAMSRAKSMKREYESVLKEVEFTILRQLARILAKDCDPLIGGLLDVTLVEDDDAAVCCVCYDEIGGEDEARGLGCGHAFHRVCIEQWIARKSNCPMCRYSMQIEDEDSNSMKIPIRAYSFKFD